jgi:hypothetical protein
MATKKSTSSKKRQKPAAETTITEPTVTEPTTEKAKPVVKVAKVKKAMPLSMSRALKDLVVREPKITIDALYAKLEAMGFKGRSKTTVATLQSEAITTLRAAVEANLFPRWD